MVLPSASASGLLRAATMPSRWDIPSDSFIGFLSMFRRPRWRQVGGMVVMRREAIERGRTMASDASLLVSGGQDAAGDHPAPEIPFVDRMAEDAFVGQLQLRQRECGRNQMKCDVGVAQLGAQPYQRIFQHDMLNVVRELRRTRRRPNDAGPADVGRGFRREQSEITNDHLAVITLMAAERVQLFKVLRIDIAV